MNRHSPHILIPLIIALSLVCSDSQAAAPRAAISQHAINDYAASFLRIRLSLVDALGLRLPNERPEAYFARMLTQAGETDSSAYTLATAFLKPIAAAVAFTAPVRGGLVPKDLRLENVALFKRASRDATALDKLYFRALAIQSPVNAGRSLSVHKEVALSGMQRRATLAGLFAQMLHVAQDGYDVLRDARP